MEDPEYREKRRESQRKKYWGDSEYRKRRRDMVESRGLILRIGKNIISKRESTGGRE